MTNLFWRRLKALRWLELLGICAFIVIAVAFVAAVVCAWIWIPELQVKQVPGLSPNEFLQRVDEHRRTLTQLLGGLVALALLWLTWKRTTATEKNVLVLQEGQFTERFTRAIDQLGATHDDNEKTPRLEVRLGGIYALEQVAKDAPEKYHWTVMEVLTA